MHFNLCVKLCLIQGETIVKYQKYNYLRQMSLSNARVLYLILCGAYWPIYELHISQIDFSSCLSCLHGT
jgi:hypothetical protein